MKLEPFIKIIIYTLTNVAVLQLTVHELNYKRLKFVDNIAPITFSNLLVERSGPL